MNEKRRVQDQGRSRNKFMGVGGEIFFAPTHQEFLGGGGQNMHCKFKTFGILDTRHIVQLPYFIPPSNKTGRKKAKSFFYVLHFQFQILKV